MASALEQVITNPNKILCEGNDVCNQDNAKALIMYQQKVRAEEVNPRVTRNKWYLKSIELEESTTETIRHTISKQETCKR